MSLMLYISVITMQQKKKLKNSQFCVRITFMCYVWRLQQTALPSLSNTSRVRSAWSTIWIFIEFVTNSGAPFPSRSRNFWGIKAWVLQFVCILRRFIWVLQMAKQMRLSASYCVCITTVLTSFCLNPAIYIRQNSLMILLYKHINIS
jgi:hypothetical protein